MTTIDGSWSIKIATPMGTQSMVLQLASEGDIVTGTSSGDAGELPIRDGKLDGDAVTFAIDVTFPFQMALQFDLTVDGDSVSGKSRAGSFPPSPVTGTRSTS